MDLGSLFGGMDGMLVQVLPLIAFVAIFYFLLLRPQQKRAKEQQAMLAAITRGDKIISNGGIVGVVKEARERELEVEIAPGVVVTLMRPMVASVIGKEGKLEAPVKKATSKAVTKSKK